MGTTLFRQFLQSLCCGSRWNYAVFWKLQHQNQMFLTWEDGYYDIPKQEHSKEYTLDNISVEGLSEMSSSNYESSSYDQTMGGDTVGAAVAYMSNIQYLLGDGVVGRVASTGNHCWVFSGDMLSGEINSNLVPEYPDEWIYQFAAGIKTILLIPVVPHGVLQLGSLEPVVEDVRMVALIKERFFGYQNFVGHPKTVAVNREFLAPSSSLLTPSLVRNLNDFLPLAIGAVKPEDSLVIDNFKPSNDRSFAENLITSTLKAHDSTLIIGADLKLSSPSTVNDFNTHLGINEETELPNFSGFGMMESTMYRCLEEGLPDFSYPNYSSMEIFGEDPDITMKSDRLIDPEFEINNLDAMDHRDVGPSLNFPVDCELHKALGPGFVPKDYPLDSSLSSNLFCSGDLISVTDGMEDKGRLLYSLNKTCVLEPSVVQTHLDVKSTGKFIGIDSSLTFSGPVTAPIKGHYQSEKSVLSGESTLSRSHVTSAFRNPTVSSSPARKFNPSLKEYNQAERSVLSGESTFPQSNVTTAFRNPTVSTSHVASSYGSLMSDLIEEEQKKNYGYSNTKKNTKVSGTGKKKGNPGENKKPRPRDRQLIQDRLKELRELVPNGGKCSIDGLLERTVAHMLFLKSVSDRADKLKHWGHQGGIDRKNKKSPEQNGSCQTGTSWAFELGTDQQVCPIIVEDLDCPGHMLIEMICDENDRFLEIAEVIHGLNLTILKGVMEKREDDTWAYFLIEAPRGLHRLDIFWPLMKLLQQSQSPISSKI